MSDLDVLIAELISGNDERAEAAVPQIAARGEAALAVLKPLLGSRHEDQRWWATRALAQMDPAPVRLIQLALRDESADVRQCAALGLLHHPSPESIPDLIVALSDHDTMVASLAANALIALGANAVPALIDVLKSGKHFTRLEAARALATIKDTRAIPALMKVLEEDSAILQYWAEKGLDKLGLGMVYIKPE
jgi:HEAT repeat protein